MNLIREFVNSKAYMRKYIQDMTAVLLRPNRIGISSYALDLKMKILLISEMSWLR